MTYEPVTLDHLLEHQSWALRLARQLVREEHEAEELVQRTWIAALRRPPSSDRGARAWIRQVILNLARERHRRASTRTRHEFASQDPGLTAPDASEDVSREEIRGRLAARLMALQEPYRTVLTLRYYEDLTSSEIAERLGVPAGTVRWRMKVGLDQLREDLDRESHGDRQRWVSALLLLVPEEAAPAGAEAAPEAAGSGLSPWLTGLVLGAGLTGLAGFLWLRDDESETVVASGDAALVGDVPPQRAALEAPPESASRQPAAALPAAEQSATTHAPPGLPVRVLDAAGQPVEGARLLVLSHGASEERARTDARGAASVPLTPPDLGSLGVPATSERVALLAVADGHAAAPLWHVAEPLVRSEPLVITLGGPARPLAGKIVDALGAPVAGAAVAWYEPLARLEAVPAGDFPGPVAQTTTTAADGRFVLPHLPGPGATLLVQAAGFASSSLALQHFDGELTLVLYPGATVTGRVLRADGRPASDVRVASEPLHKCSEWSSNVPGHDLTRRGFPEVTRTDADGRYRLEHLTPGARLLWAGDEGGAASASFKLEEGGSEEWNPILGEGHALRLRLEDEEGVPLAGWQVVLRRPGAGNTWWIRRLAADARGRIETHECPSGEVFLDVLDRTGTGPSLASRRLSASKEEVVLRLSTRALATVRGTLLDPAGSPPADGALQLVSLRTGLKAEPGLEADGRFALRLAAGSYAAVVRVAEGAALLASFELESGAEHELGTLQLPAPGTLRLTAGALANGTVRTPAYTVYALFDARRFLECAQGEFTGEALLTLLPGRYRVLLFDAAGNPPSEHLVTITSFEEARLVP